MHKISKMKEPRGRDRFLNKQEMKNLMHACLQSKSTYLYPVVLMALTTGMRQGEILSLRWNDIDFEKNTIYVRETKNGEARTARMVSRVKKALLLLFEKSSPSKQLIFAPKKNFSSKVAVKKAWKMALKKACISNFRFHDLRHTFASYVAQNGATNIQIAAALGHKTLQMVHRYSHVRGEHTHPLSEFMESLIDSSEAE